MCNFNVGDNVVVQNPDYVGGCSSVGVIKKIEWFEHSWRCWVEFGSFGFRRMFIPDWLLKV